MRSSRETATSTAPARPAPSVLAVMRPVSVRVSRPARMLTRPAAAVGSVVLVATLPRNPSLPMWMAPEFAFTVPAVPRPLVCVPMLERRRSMRPGTARVSATPVPSPFVVELMVDWLSVSLGARMVMPPPCSSLVSMDASSIEMPDAPRRRGPVAVSLPLRATSPFAATLVRMVWPPGALMAARSGVEPPLSSLLPFLM